MRTEKIGNELSRLVNEISRKYRNRKDTPSPQDITSLAKLADSYRDILLIEGEPGKGRDPKLYGQVGGYEALVAMHQRRLLLQAQGEEENEDEDDQEA